MKPWPRPAEFSVQLPRKPRVYLGGALYRGSAAPCHSRMMQRRSLLKLGLASAAVLSVAGGAIALLQPGLVDSRLTVAGRAVFTAVGRAVLEGSLPPESVRQQIAIAGLLERIDGLVAALPPHAQDELAQLLSLLHSGAGRRAIAGLATDWAQASTSDVQQALQSMRLSSLALRQQAYQALHDIVGGAYYSDPSTWVQLGYPGPNPIVAS